MLSFEERMALLDMALEEHTPESLFEELSSFPAYGPSLANFVVDITDEVTLVETSNAEVCHQEEVTFTFDSTEYGEAA
ncbi:hypothetical protein [Pantoea agglomerans]|uniref:hypothetical protein n=1 Tax=Enterobacter agglomerans TaxID=549 RepID=UPI001F40E6E2|nr:hypothetical protein [Pantoea agglomerans]UJL36648.1 hypothetical protein JK642_16240 [Pantoea agglomerans]